MRIIFRTGLLLAVFLPTLSARGPTNPADSPIFGGYNGSFIASGLGLKKPLPAAAPLAAQSPWSMYCWVRPDQSIASDGRILIAGVGDSAAAAPGQRFFALLDGKYGFWAGERNILSGNIAAERGKWHLLSLTYDGATATFYVDGSESGHTPITMPPTAPVMQLAPDTQPWPDAHHFAGEIAKFSLVAGALASRDIHGLLAEASSLDLTEFEAGSKDWPVQSREQAGYRAPQDPSTLPKSPVPPSKPVAKPAYAGPALQPREPNQWALARWRLIAAPQVTADGAQISSASFQSNDWYQATVPGTVLTTLVDRGLYPDPDYGLNNLAIPESLSRQDYWYRTEFTPPSSLSGRRLTLTFHGINYAAVVWLNGKRIGSIKGAFIRGIFDVTGVIEPGRSNALAVRISPPPHPGIPQEQSIKAGPGENGGILCLDGPTFIDTEGWDWIPGIRDRNTGLWQEVTLAATGFLKLGDAQVVTKLPLPDTSRAAVTIAVPVRNDGPAPLQGVVHARFEGVEIDKNVTLPPGESVVNLAPEEFQQLSLSNPRLWWPNGYGSPELYHLRLSVTSPEGESDAKSLRFGIREITYELSLLDHFGQLRRVEYAPTSAPNANIVDITHEGIIQTTDGWVYSLRQGAENSPAIHPLDDRRITPYLVIRVNGVRIACKGGNWGMDDSRKRVSREHLEPFFRLHREANLNIIRNWCGQSTEEIFYDLADEYGLLVWNDFWESTQNYNVEPSDTALFLQNARDTVSRFRNHPSIVVWCGRNEGVPSPAVNIGLDTIIREEDGTRFYAPSSNVVNLQNSGPYKYYQPVDYFTKFARGFAVELGIPSMPTIDAFKSFVPPAEQWPPNDTWAYHDWHASGNGVVTPFMNALANELGAASNLEDFERKAQLLNYVTHRAIFEGFNAHLWNPNSGRMLWMTQPAWPSTMWQILSSDYDTQASFYGVKKASEPVHVQLNLPDLATAVINNTNTALENLTVRARVFANDGKLLYSHEEKLNAPAIAETGSFSVAQAAAAGLVFVKLELLNSGGQPLSENFYWYAADNSTYRQLTQLPPAKLTASVKQSNSGDWVRVTVDLSNPGPSFALMSKLTVRNPDGTRVLPAYYSDNYVSFLPGETRRIRIECPANAVKGNLEIGLTGWNVQASTVPAARE